MKIAVIDKQPSNLKYEKYFNFNYDLFHLSSVPKTKVLKIDVDIDFNPDDFNYIVLVGAEAVKYYTGKTIGELAGHIVDKKYIPLTSPAAVLFRPELKDSFENALRKLHLNLEGNNTISDSGNFIGIDNEEQALQYLTDIKNSGAEFVALDTESSALYPRDGTVLGQHLHISLCYRHVLRFLLRLVPDGDN